jgi:hypothetical protein
MKAEGCDEMSDEEYYDLDPYRNEYCGMRNPYHMIKLWENDFDADTLSKEDKKNKFRDTIQGKCKKNKNSVKINLFKPKRTKENGETYYPSPLYPFVEKWYDDEVFNWFEEEEDE